jgi:Ca2+-binding RTX toxin-like protein
VSYAPSPGAVIVTLTPSATWSTNGSATGWGDDTLTSIENVTGSRFNDTITGDANANVLRGGGGADRLTGGGGADKFDYRVLGDSLLGPSLSLVATIHDVITDFNANTGGDKLLVGTARAGFLNAGAVSALTASAISAKLTSTAFLANFAASFQLGSGVSQRSFIAINNNVAGFNQATDAVIEVTGLSGTINATHFVTS